MPPRPCGKVCFDKKTALTKKNFLHRIGRAKELRIYYCDQHNAWHLTKERKHGRYGEKPWENKRKPKKSEDYLLENDLMG